VTAGYLSTNGVAAGYLSTNGVAAGLSRGKLAGKGPLANTQKKT